MSTLHSCHPSQTRSGERGFALVLVLSMIALVTVLVVAYLNRSTSENIISRASAGGGNSEILARTALEFIESDLRSEIVTNSIAYPATNPGSIDYYRPSTPQAAVPVRVLKQADLPNQGTLPNLVKVSASGSAFFTNGPVRASSISTTRPSIDGKAYTADRWNAPLLLTNPFTPPDWIYLTRSGTNPIDANLTPANKANGNDPILGRFAYMIYDEGGLLDINHAGAPTAALGVSGGITPAAAARKGYLALADLTKIGLSSDDIRKILDWRNAGSSQSPANFLAKLKADPSGQMRMAEGDRPFVSRSQLLSFFRTNSLPTNSLAFLGTFSRGLNQPSYGTSGPKIPGRPAFPPLLDSTSGTYNLPPGGYSGNNDIAGQETLANPNFLSLRVTRPFPRFNPYLASLGIVQQAKVGDLLVPHRFPLDRLAWLTYQGPIAPGGNLNRTLAAPLLAAGFSEDFLKLGTAENISSAFGLTWAPDPGVPGSQRKVWVYTHSTGVDVVSGKPSAVGNLSDVQKLGRDPDFFELLAAAIYCGSLGKGAYGDRQTGLWQHAHDVRVDYQVLQIGANIIDQYKPDGFPTEIALPLTYPGPTVGLLERKVRGSQSLPMLIGARDQAILFSPYSFNYNGSNNITNFYSTAYGARTTFWYDALAQTVTGTPAVTNVNAINNPGQVAFIHTPWIWNPYSSNSTPGNPAPTQFRILTTAGDPIFMTNAATTVNSFKSEWCLNGNSSASGGLRIITNTAGTTPYGGTNTTATIALPQTQNGITTTNYGPTTNNTELDFTIPTGSRLFTQPTALLRINTPSGSGLRLGQKNTMRTNFPNGMTNVNYPNVAYPSKLAPGPFDQGIIGVLVGTAPALVMSNMSFGGPTYGNCIACTTHFNGSFTCTGKSGQTNNLTHLLQYQDPAGNWVTYDVKTSIVGPKTDAYFNTDQGFANAEELVPTGAPYAYCNMWNDPRTGRFGAPAIILPPQINTSYLNDSMASLATLRPDSASRQKYAGFNSGWPTVNGKTFFGPNLAGSLAQIGFLARGTPPNGASPSMQSALNSGGGGFSQGWAYFPWFFPQNSSFSGNYNWNGYLDPDGVQRGGMAFYASDNSTAGMPLAQTNFPARPIILHRPFVSVADLGYTFRDMPFRNLDFMTQQSGDSALLDTFCIHEDMTTNCVVSGKVNLNTRNPEVLAALLSGTGMEEYDTLGSATLSTAAVSNVVSLMTNWTQSTNPPAGPFTQLGDLVGRYITNSASPYAPTAIANGAVGAGAYTSYYTNALNFPEPGQSTNNVLQRYREAPVRVLSEVGETRVWNLLIDLVAQSGICPPAASGLDRFSVKGETRWWIHLAIDRATGRILDSQVENVSQ